PDSFGSPIHLAHHRACQPAADRHAHPVVVGGRCAGARDRPAISRQHHRLCAAAGTARLRHAACGTHRPGGPLAAGAHAGAVRTRRTCDPGSSAIAWPHRPEGAFRHHCWQRGGDGGDGAGGVPGHRLAGAMNLPAPAHLLQGLLWSLVTLAVFWAARRFHRRWPLSLLAPILVTPIVVGLVILATGTAYSRYIDGTGWLVWMLGPATVAFA